MSRCIDCKRFDLRTQPKLSAHLFGLCKAGARWAFLSASHQRECGQYSEAPKDVRAARQAWMAKIERVPR